jgi:hypothetical protein
MVFNTTHNNISVILWLSVLLMEETEVLRENQRPAVESNWKRYNVVSTKNGSSLGNIHFSNNNGSLPFYVNLIYHRQDLCRTWLWATPWLSNKKQALLTLPSTFTDFFYMISRMVFCHKLNQCCWWWYHVLKDWYKQFIIIICL